MKPKWWTRLSLVPAFCMALAAHASAHNSPAASHLHERHFAMHAQANDVHADQGHMMHGHERSHCDHA